MNTAFRNFMDFFKEIRGGHFADMAGAAMQEVVQNVENTGKKATLVIELTVQKTGDDDGTVMVYPKVKKKVNEPQARPQAFFVSPENNLFVSNPRQSEMFSENVKEITKPSTYSKEIV